jgi:hypothetical protein
LIVLQARLCSLSVERRKIAVNCRLYANGPAGLLFHIYNPPCKDKTSPGEPTPSIKNETPKMGLDLVIEAIFPLD